jgi:tripartite-type tricarboxylate transporter receptor subunit TctC
MLKSTVVVTMICALLAIACSAPAQNYPVRPVLLITAEAGSGGDVSSRLIAPGLTASLGQQVVVENRGGHVVRSAGFVAKAAPDGYTLLLHGGTVWLAQFMGDAGYDAVKDLTPVTQIVSIPNVLVVNPTLPVDNLRTLLALAKSRPGQLAYASGPTGSTPHLTAELFKAMAGVNILRVPYQGTGAAINDVISGQVQLMFSNALSVMAQVKSRRLRALAVTTAQPSALMPGLPTVAASGVPGFEAAAILGVLAPAKTPSAIIARLQHDIVQAATDPQIKERFFAVGAEVVAGTPEQFAAVIKGDMERLGKVIRDQNIRAD